MQIDHDQLTIVTFWGANRVSYSHIITINVPVVNMAQDVMSLLGAKPFRGSLKGVGPEKRDLFWALKWQRAKRVAFGSKKSQVE